MKTPGYYIGAFAACCIIALVIGTSSAGAITQQGINHLPHMAGQSGSEKMLDNLTARGYDVAVIRTAVTGGDYTTAHTLMQEFWTAHPDLFPARGERTGCAHTGGQRGHRNNR